MDESFRHVRTDANRDERICPKPSTCCLAWPQAVLSYKITDMLSFIADQLVHLFAKTKKLIAPFLECRVDAPIDDSKWRL